MKKSILFPRGTRLRAKLGDQAFAQADTALSTAKPAAHTVVIVITDGEPNCGWDQTKTTSTITSWFTQHEIETSVVRLPSTIDAGAPMVLNALAQAGGTVQALVPADPASMTKQLADVLRRALRAPAMPCK